MYVVCMYPVSLRVCIYAHVRNGPPKVSRFPKGTKTRGTRLTSDKFWLNLATVENSMLPRYRSPAINGMPGCRARLYGNKSQFPNGLGRLLYAVQTEAPRPPRHFHDLFQIVKCRMNSFSAIFHPVISSLLNGEPGERSTLFTHCTYI